MGSGLSDLFDLTSGVGTLSGSYVAPKAVSAVAPWEAGGGHAGSFQWLAGLLGAAGAQGAGSGVEAWGRFPRAGVTGAQSKSESARRKWGA